MTVGQSIGDAYHVWREIVRRLSPSGSGTLIFSTDIKLFTSLLMLSATPGYCKGAGRVCRLVANVNYSSWFYLFIPQIQSWGKKERTPYASLKCTPALYLYFHSHFPSVRQDSEMHLTNGGSCKGFVLKWREHVLPARAQLFLQNFLQTRHDTNTHQTSGTETLMTWARYRYVDGREICAGQGGDHRKWKDCEYNLISSLK